MSTSIVGQSGSGSGGGGGGGNAAASPTGIAVPADAGYTGFDSGGNLVGVSASNPLPVTAGTISGTLTDRSGTVTAGGTSQTLAAINAARKYILIENPINAVNGETLFINFTSAASTSAAGSIQIAPGGSINLNIGTYITTELITVTAATTGHAFIAKEG
jgi:hypothetical protein